MSIDIRDNKGKVLFTGDSDECELFLLKERFKWAYSYTLPIWRMLFFSKQDNYQYWLKVVNKRLCA